METVLSRVSDPSKVFRYSTQKIFPSEVIDLLSGCLFGEPRILASTRQRQHTETHLDHLFIVQPFCYFFNMSH